MEIIVTALQIIGVLSLGGVLLLFIWSLQKVRSESRKAAKKNYEASQRNDFGLSGELIYDYVSLEEANFLQDEKRLIEECGDELRKRAKESGKPIKLGYFKKEGWTGGLPFYLFFCSSCKNLTVGYKHGYGPCLSCRTCGAETSF